MLLLPLKMAKEMTSLLVLLDKFDKERKVKGRKQKVEDRGIYYYAQDNDFSKKNNEIPKDFENKTSEEIELEIAYEGQSKESALATRELNKESVKYLEQEMKKAAKQMDFEKAAKIRDQMKNIINEK